MHLVLFQPEIPHNMGALVRFAACMGMALDVIEPCGFLLTDKHLKRASMDYREFANVRHFPSWQVFCEVRQGLRRVAVRPRAPQTYTEFSFEASDLLIMGRESSGLPPEIVADCHASVAIPMMPGTRSLNLSLSAAIVATEALRQTNGLPLTI